MLQEAAKGSHCTSELCAGCGGTAGASVQTAGAFMNQLVGRMVTEDLVPLQPKPARAVASTKYWMDGQLFNTNSGFPKHSTTSQLAI